MSCPNNFYLDKKATFAITLSLKFQILELASGDNIPNEKTIWTISEKVCEGKINHLSHKSNL